MKTAGAHVNLELAVTLPALRLQHGHDPHALAAADRQAVLHVAHLVRRAGCTRLGQRREVPVATDRIRVIVVGNAVVLGTFRGYGCSDCRRNAGVAVCSFADGGGAVTHFCGSGSSIR